MSNRSPLTAPLRRDNARLRAELAEAIEQRNVYRTIVNRLHKGRPVLEVDGPGATGKTLRTWEPFSNIKGRSKRSPLPPAPRYSYPEEWELL
jgi:hypothetical protein